MTKFIIMSCLVTVSHYLTTSFLFFTQHFTCSIYICVSVCAYYICLCAYLGAYLQVVRPCRGHSKPIAFMHQRAHKITRVIDDATPPTPRIPPPYTRQMTWSIFMRESSDKSKLYSSAKAEIEAKRAGSARQA